MLASESARFGANSVLVLEDGPSVRERYKPMLRLLTQDDEKFLLQQGFPGIARRLQREHRSCYFHYLACLMREIRSARKLGALAMASKERWSFWSLSAQVVLSESSLLYLRWLGCRHALGISVAARDVRECLDFLLVQPRFRVAAT